MNMKKEDAKKVVMPAKGEKVVAPAKPETKTPTKKK